MSMIRGWRGHGKGMLMNVPHSPSYQPWHKNLPGNTSQCERSRCAVRPLDRVRLAADAADFDSQLRMRVEQRLLSTPMSRRVTLHVERRHAALRSTGCGSASATRLEASTRTFGDMEDSRDKCVEVVCDRARRWFRPLCEPMAEPSDFARRRMAW